MFAGKEAIEQIEDGLAAELGVPHEVHEGAINVGGLGEAAGVDVVEIGVPFSDPTADGPAIQAASQRALKRGATLAKILAMIAGLRRSRLI